MIQFLLNKTMLHFQLIPMSKVDQSQLRIHEVPPLQRPKGHNTEHGLMCLCSDTGERKDNSDGKTMFGLFLLVRTSLLK